MKKILIISSFFIVLIAFSTIGYQMVSANEKIIEVKDEIKKQVEFEKYITPYGYTIDNPNIIINPYGNSPLTAIILFETDAEEEVTITIAGKDNNSTYTNTFKKATKHYLPIYGLYPNTTNKITIEYNHISKIIEIETDPLPYDLIPKTISNNSNHLYFITTDTYTYAIDNNNEVRWYLTKNYSQKIARLKNGNFLLSTDTLNPNNYHTGLVEIDLFGKIYKQYNIDNGYYGSYAETENSLFILSNDLLELDKQTGIILNKYPFEESYNEVFYDEETNNIILSNPTTTLNIDRQTNETYTTTNTTPLTNQQEILLPLYSTNNHHKLSQGTKLTTNQKTEESNQNIFLVGYKDIDDNYKKYNIEIIKTADNLQITAEVTSNDKIYLILDKFLDKKVYDIRENYTIINKEGLTGKYSIYIKINDTIYKTDNYIKF